MGSIRLLKNKYQDLSHLCAVAFGEGLRPQPIGQPPGGAAIRRGLTSGKNAGSGPETPFSNSLLKPRRLPHHVYRIRNRGPAVWHRVLPVFRDRNCGKDFEDDDGVCNSDDLCDGNDDADHDGRGAEDLDLPKHKITLLQAVGFRLRRNYVWIFLMILGGWIVKLMIHPDLALSWREIWHRIGVGHLPPALIVFSGILFYGGLAVVMTYGRHLSGGEPEDEIMGLERNLGEWKR